MPEREKAICGRLRLFRVDSGLSQSEFAKLCNLNQRVLASYEYARSQLNYPAAWKILTAFPLLNPVWLAGENASRQEFPCFLYPTPEATGYGPRTPFSVVYDHLLRKGIVDSSTAYGANLSCPFMVRPDAAGRIAAKESFAERVGIWLAHVPDANVKGFLNNIYVQCGRLFKESHPDTDPKTIRQRAMAMMKIANKRRLVFLGNAPGVLSGQATHLLTGNSLKGNMPGVKSEIHKLIELVKRKASAPGAKAQLARTLGVSPARISEWLSGKKEPGGEYAIRLLNWVQQDRQQ